MRAVEIREAGRPPVVTDRAEPTPEAGAVLVEVLCAPITPLDLLYVFHVLSDLREAALGVIADWRARPQCHATAALAGSGATRPDSSHRHNAPPQVTKCHPRSPVGAFAPLTVRA